MTSSINHGHRVPSILIILSMLIIVFLVGSVSKDVEHYVDFSARIRDTKFHAFNDLHNKTWHDINNKFLSASNVYRDEMIGLSNNHIANMASLCNNLNTFVSFQPGVYVSDACHFAGETRFLPPGTYDNVHLTNMGLNKVKSAIVGSGCMIKTWPQEYYSNPKVAPLIYTKDNRCLPMDVSRISVDCAKATESNVHNIYPTKGVYFNNHCQSSNLVFLPPGTFSTQQLSRNVITSQFQGITPTDGCFLKVYDEAEDDDPRLTILQPEQCSFIDARKIEVMCDSK